MSTLPEWWTVPYPEVSSVESAAAYLDALGGALNRTQDDGSWVLSTGEQEMVRSGSSEELDSFVLGFALAHLICERHGPIGRRQQAAAEGETQSAESDADADAGTDSGSKAESEDQPERASLSVVPDTSDDEDSDDSEDSKDGDDSDGDDSAGDDSAADDGSGENGAGEDAAGDDEGETVGGGSGGGGKRRRRRR